MPAAAESHQHRNTTKVGHKPFKPKFASKNALKDRAKGRIEQLLKPKRPTPHQQVMSKFDRKNQAKQKRLANKRDNARNTNVFFGKDGAPRIIAVVPLSDHASTWDAVRTLNSSLDIETENLPGKNSCIVDISRFRQKLQYIAVQKNLLAAMDACRVADYVLFVLTADEDVDEVGETILKCVEGQGISQIYTVVQRLEYVSKPKKRPQVVSSLKSFMSRYFPEQERVFSLDAPQECLNLLRSLCTTVPKGIGWREDRSWMFVENLSWQDSPRDGSLSGKQEDTRIAVVTGVVRGKSLNADRLVHIGDWGDFQIEKIVAAPLDTSQKLKDYKMTVDVDLTPTILDKPSNDQDNLDELAPEEAIMEDANGVMRSIAPSERKSVLLDNYPDLEDSEEEEDVERIKRLPRGTSKYQSAWYLGDDSDSGSDMEDVEELLPDELSMEDVAVPADGTEGATVGIDIEPTEAAMSEAPETENFADRSPEDQAEAKELASYREQKKTDAEEDRQFPDEIELHPNVSARERLARYRGLKSLRTSPWNTDEDALYRPVDWDRLLEINDYRGARNKVLRETLVGGVKPGTRVQVYLRNVPISFQDSHPSSRPLTLFSLLRHEHKRTTVDVSITLNSSLEEPLKSKEELIMQCGPRRFIINPLFSQGGNTPNNVHKFERYLHPGRTVIASVTAPLTWGAVPILFFKRTASQQRTTDTAEMDVDESTTTAARQPLTLVARGTILTQSSPPASARSAPRIIAKRITLTGQPYKIHKKLVTVRYMFFNAADVAYFGALPLWTNRGRQGVIKESLGTHGYFKATFDAKMGMMDAVGVSLYKRVWPRPARPFTIEDGAARATL